MVYFALVLKHDTCPTDNVIGFTGSIVLILSITIEMLHWKDTEYKVAYMYMYVFHV